MVNKKQIKQEVRVSTNAIVLLFIIINQGRNITQ